MYILYSVSLTHLQEKLYRDDSGGGGSSPFFVYSRRQIVSNVEAYNSALATVHLPYFIGYSVKVRQFCPMFCYFGIKIAPTCWKYWGDRSLEAMIGVDWIRRQMDGCPGLWTRNLGLIERSAAAWRRALFITWAEWTLAMSLSWWQHYKHFPAFVVVLLLLHLLLIIIIISLYSIWCIL